MISFQNSNVFIVHNSFPFYKGDRLTDERVNGVQRAMKNEESPTERFELFISKIEDFHRLMNFLEVLELLLLKVLVVLLLDNSIDA